MTTFTHQLLSRKTSMPEVWQCECEYSSRTAIVSVAVLRMGYTEVVFIQPGGKVDIMWRGAWQRLATRHQGEMWPLQMVTAAGRCSLSHRQKQKLAAWEPSVHWAKQFVHQNQIARIRTRLTCLLRVFFNRQSTIIEISPQLTKWRERLSKA